MSEKILSSLKRAYPKWVEGMWERYRVRRLTPEQTKALLDSKRLSLQLSAKRKKRGLEDCLEYEDEYRIIHIWTSYVAAEEKFRKHDCGWVLIIDKRYPNDPCFFSFPIRRTKRFLKRLEKWFKGFWEIVNNWHPPCNACSADPIIKLVRGEKLHEVAYFCPNEHRLANTSVYTGITEESKIFMSRYFQHYDEYRKKDQENGIFRMPARFIRAGILKIRSEDDGVYYDGGYNQEYSDGPHLEE